MEFLKTRIQGITGHQLAVTPIFEFLHSLCHGLSQKTKIRIEEFQLKWESQRYAKQLVLAYITGSWKPDSAARTPEVSSQKTWEHYVKQTYKLAFSATNVSTCIGPFTFNEMIQHEFWQDLYNAFGQKVTAFILEKTLLIFEVEKQFYVLIAANGCTLHQKLSKAVVRPITRSGGGQPIQLNGSFNPYKLQDECKVRPVKLLSDPVNPVKCMPNIQTITRRKRLHSYEEEDGLISQFQKKAKISKSVINNEIHNSAAISNIEKTTSEKQSHENVVSVIRWFKPSEQIVQFLIEEREKVKQRSGIYNSQPRPEDGMTQLHYVGILEDREYRKITRLNIVHKQYRPLDFRFPFHTPEWKGLIIKEPKIRSPNRKYNVNVYRISENFARNNNIRVNVKQRQRRKRQIHPPSNFTSQTTESTNPNNAMSAQSQPSVPEPVNGTKPNSHSGPSTISDFIATYNVVQQPFDPLLTLNTLPALYNKSSWSRWPKSHIITAACLKPLENGTHMLLEDVLGTNVGMSNQILDILKITFSNKFQLMDILKKLIVFHKRVKDIHKLVKRCVMLWVVKYQNKIISKENKAIQRQAWRVSNPRRNKALESHNPIEVIDITGDSQTATVTVTRTQHQTVGDNPISEESTILTASGKTENHDSSEIKLSNDNPAAISNQELRRPISYSKLKEKIPHSCILMTLKHIVHLNGVEALLGSKKNLRTFYRFIRQSLILAGTKSSLQLGQLMAQLDPCACSWIPTDISHALKESLLAKVAKWVFSNYVITILKTSFYVTEINTSRLHACFYLRESWKSISESVRHRLLKSLTLSHLGTVQIRPGSRGRSLMGINSRIRFLPKRNNDMRPIISLKREARNRWDETNAKVIIDYIVRKRTPYRIRDTNLLRQRWLTFLEEWQTLNRPKLYFVRGDVQDAYPSVDILKLKAILDGVGKELGTMSQKEFKVFSKSRVMFRKAMISWNHPGAWTASICVRPCLVQINDKHNIRLKPDDVFRKLFPYANHNVLRIGKHKYNFQRGLPQGWVLSEGYCNVYYGAMDLKHLSRYLNNKGEFFNTSVDDYLYITSNPRLAAKFLDKMGTGIPTYNCKFNSSKILTNIYPKAGWPIPLQECEWVTFCGWCFCLTCGHIMRDFGAYAEQDMASSLSFIPRNVTSPENFLVGRMKMMLPARLHHFMLDPMINCRARIALNIWEAGFIFAFRFYAICRVIYPNLRALQDPKRVKHSVAAIIVCARAVSRTIVSTFGTTYTSAGKNIKCVTGEILCPCLNSYHGLPQKTEYTRSFPIQHQPQGDISDEQLQEPEILYIVFHAFSLKLHQHSSVFGKEVLPRLNKMMQFQRSLLSHKCQSFLDIVLRNQMPFNFQNIKI